MKIATASPFTRVSIAEVTAVIEDSTTPANMFWESIWSFQV